jgi:hypothetical protein
MIIIKTVFLIKTIKGEVIQKIFYSDTDLMEYAKENNLIPCIAMMGTIE